MFNVEYFMKDNSELTLAEVRAWFLSLPEVKKQLDDIEGALKSKNKEFKRIRFVLRTEPETEAPEDMLMGEFKKLCEQKKAHISIDFGEGGMGAEKTEPLELV